MRLLILTAALALYAGFFLDMRASMEEEEREEKEDAETADREGEG